MKKIRFIFVLVVALIMTIVTSAWADDPDVTVEAGPGIEIVEVTVGEAYDETYGPLETVTITWGPRKATADTVGMVILAASAVFLAGVAGLRKHA